MEWRCAWCGKPHEANDPPCDNCGHGEFEKAVVPIASDSADDGESQTVWVCTECEKEHPKHTPPCDRCGGGPLERREVTYDQEAVLAEMRGEDDTTRSSAAEIGYFDVLDTQLVLGFLAVGTLVAIIALGLLGVINVPFLPSSGGPVPGNATTVDGLSLTAVEAAYVTELNVRRSTAGYGNLSRDSDLASVATWFNQNRVRQDYTDSEGIDRQEFRRRIGDACGDADLVPVAFEAGISIGGNTTSSVSSPGELAGVLVTTIPEASTPTNVSKGIVGVDIHAAPDGRLYVTQFAC